MSHEQPKIQSISDTEVWGDFYCVELPARGMRVYVCDDSVDSELLARQIAELDHDTNPPPDIPDAEERSVLSVGEIIGLTRIENGLKQSPAPSS